MRLEVRTTGRKERELTILGVRELVREDLSVLDEKRARIPVVARFRDPHHRLARLFAAGLRLKDVAAKSGYSYNRIAVISNDPAFQDLVSTYRVKVDRAYEQNVDDYAELVTGNMMIAERQLREKLEIADNEEELLPVKDLLAISRDAADRFGYGKKQTNLNVNVDFASQLEKAIARSGKVIESTVVPASKPLMSPRHVPQALALEPQPLIRRRRVA